MKGFIQGSHFKDEDSLDESSYVVQHFSANNFYPDKERIKIEKHFEKVLDVTDKFNRQSVSYQLSKKDLIHSWLKYKEGFSADLVNIFLKEMGAKPDDLIMDPFMGSGTTALVCQMNGINSIGYDIMPISTVSINAKSNVLNYDVTSLSKIRNALAGLSVPHNYKKDTPVITITESAYPDQNSKFFSYIQEWIGKFNFSDIEKNLLTLCVVNSLERCSFTRKDGQYLGWDYRSQKVIDANASRVARGKKPFPIKVVRDPICDGKATVLEEFDHVISDISIIQESFKDNTGATIDYKQSSVLYELPKLPDNILKGAITSPPYCNRYDYTRTYALELVYLGLREKTIRDLRQSLLSCTVESKSKANELEAFYSSIGQKDRYDYILKKIQSNGAFQEVMGALEKRMANGDLNNNGVVRMVDGYFTELAFIYAELFRVCKPGAYVVFVNDNVRYGGEVIPVDFLSSSFAEQFGFETKEVYCLKQQKGNSSQQMAKFGRVALRKSITVWVKP